ncbi:MAG: hypothetical protein UT55_C0087G0004 [Candidatus Peregrinibacteria bacterium GW2011_GWE2_39_6]|nr:MAG: hypothetical protein UT55_C0087G0004 [Candidatus Peregrinibacteria bacterium GW2011_GWE2_39_6]
MLKLLFINDATGNFTDKELASLLKRALKFLPSIPEKTLELIFIDDQKMKEINLKTRQINKPTDVLSFANREISNTALKDAACLGQIFISVETATKNAKELHQTLKEELNFLFIHGLLHLLGYDHQTQIDDEKMMNLAYKILRRKQ